MAQDSVVGVVVVYLKVQEEICTLDVVLFQLITKTTKSELLTSFKHYTTKWNERGHDKLPQN